MATTIVDPFKPAGSGIVDPFRASAITRPTLAPAPSGIVRRVLGDTAVDLTRGVVSAGEAAVGLASIPSLGAAGKGMEMLGYDPKAAHESLSELYSPERQAANAKVEQAEGFVDTLGAMIQNPSTIAGSVVQSAPSIVGGAGLARAGGQALGKLGAAQLAHLPLSSSGRLLLAGAGEGAVMAGSQAEGIRQQTDDGLLTPEQALLATATGAGGAVLGVGGGSLAKKLGIADVDVALQGSRATTETPRTMLRRGAEGALVEGALEEMPQSMLEQTLQNVALDRPADEGVTEAGAMGLLTGSALGGPIAAIQKPELRPQAKPGTVQSAAEALPGNPPPPAGGPPPVDAATEGSALLRRPQATPGSIASAAEVAPTVVTKAASGASDNAAAPVETVTSGDLPLPIEAAPVPATPAPKVPNPEGARTAMIQALDAGRAPDNKQVAKVFGLTLRQTAELRTEIQQERRAAAKAAPQSTLTESAPAGEPAVAQDQGEASTPSPEPAQAPLSERSVTERGAQDETLAAPESQAPADASIPAAAPAIPTEETRDVQSSEQPERIEPAAVGPVGDLQPAQVGGDDAGGASGGAIAATAAAPAAQVDAPAVDDAPPEPANIRYGKRTAQPLTGKKPTPDTAVEAQAPRAPLSVRMGNQEIAVESFEDASRKFLELKRQTDIGGMPVVELIDGEGKGVGWIGHRGEVYAGDFNTERTKPGSKDAVYHPPGKTTRTKQEVIDGEATRIAGALPADISPDSQINAAPAAQESVNEKQEVPAGQEQVTEPAAPAADEEGQSPRVLSRKVKAVDDSELMVLNHGLATVRVLRSEWEGGAKALRVYTKNNRPGMGVAKRENLSHAGLPAAQRETITPAEDTSLGNNENGEPVYERKDGSRYVMRNGRPNFGGVLQTAAEATAERAEQAPATIADVANEAATSPKNDLPQPTDAQKEAGNYQKGHISIRGLGISIENPAGSKRRPEWPALKSHYGYFKGTVGKDKDHVDVFVSDQADNAELPVFVIDQNNRDGGFDEHKVMLGFADEEAARKAYLANYTKGWTGLGAITQMSLEEFKAWVYDQAKTKKRAAPETLSESRETKPADATPRPAKKETKPGNSETGANTKDSGEELWANRRNSTGKGMVWGDVETLNATLKAREVIKSKVWPRPDYAALVEGGIPKPLAHILKQIYDAIAAKPIANRVRGVTLAAPTDEQYQHYIEGVQKVRDAAFAWVRGVMGQGNVDQLMSSMDGSSSYGSAASAVRKFFGNGPSILDAVFPDNGAYNKSDRWRGSPQNEANSRLVWLLGGRPLIGVLSPGVEEAHAAIKAIKTGWPAPQEAWEKSYQIREFKAGEKVYRNGQQETLTEPEFLVTKGRRIIVDALKTREAATQAAKAEWEKNRAKGGDGAKAEAPVALQDTRDGPPRRHANEDITSDQLRETFGFKGVNFGTWMKGNSPAMLAERQAHLNNAYDAFTDMAELLGLPPKAVSLNGMLGLAIGAQGHGGKRAAAAHFVPGVNEINLTRESGAGSLAHEWAHALDHYFASQGGLATAKEPFFTEHVLSTTGNLGVRPEIATSFRTIVNAMLHRKETPEEATARFNSHQNVARAGLDRRLARIRGQIETLAIKAGSGRDRDGWLAMFDELAERLRRGDLGTGYLSYGKGRGDSDVQVVAMVAMLYREATGRKYEFTSDLGMSARGVANGFLAKQSNASHEPQNVPSDFRKEARLLDGSRKTAYWSTTLEMFARAFQSYVLDRLATASARNDYLTRPQMDEETIQSAKGDPLLSLLLESGDRYPRGAERAAINAAFDALVGQFKTETTPEGRVRLYSFSSESAGAGMPVAQVERLATAALARAKNAPRVVVVEKPPHDVAEGVEGWYEPDTGTVTLVAGNLRSAERALQVLAHEAVGHYGMEAITGPAVWKQISETIGKMAANPKHAGLFRELQDRYGHRLNRRDPEFIKEAIAVMVEKGVRNSVLDRLVAAFRQFVRQVLGINVKFSEAELRQQIQRAARFVQKGGTAIDRLDAPAVQLSRAIDPGGNLVEAFRRLAKYDDAFNYPTSDKDTFAGVLGDILPDVRARVAFTEKGKARFESGGTILPATRTVVEMGTPGNSQKVVVWEETDGDRIFINASDLEPGKSQGSALYMAVLNYAHNTGKVFVGDPSGLSDAATLRRTELMASAALKFGSTTFMRPHARQLSKTRPWQTPVTWKEGDFMGNLQSLLQAAYNQTAYFAPGLRNVRFDPVRKELVGPGGRVVTDDGLEDIARDARAAFAARPQPGRPDGTGAAAFGRATIARGVLADSVLREAGVGRSDVVDSLQGPVPGSRGNAPAGLSKTLYSRPAATEPGDITLSEKAKQAPSAILKRVAGKITDWKPALLGAIPLNYLADFAHKNMPAVKQFVDLRQQLEAFRNKQHQAMDAIAQDWLSYATVGGWKGWLGAQNERGKELSDLMHDATIAGVDPSLPAAEYAKDAEKSALYTDLRKRWDAMPPEGQALFARVRTAYADHTKAVEDALEENLRKLADFHRDLAEREYQKALKRIGDMDVPDGQKAAMKFEAREQRDRAIRAAGSSVMAKIAGLRQVFESMRVEAPYFPLKRFGDFFVAVRTKQGKLVSFSKFETYNAANTFAEAQRDAGRLAHIGRDVEAARELRNIDPEFVAKIDEVLAGLQDSGPTLGERLATGERVTTQQADDTDRMKNIRDAIYQQYLESLPDLSLRKSFIHRKKTPGYHPDALRSFASVMFHGSYQLARLKFSVDLQSALAAAEDQAEMVDPVEGPALVSELGKRMAWIQNPQGGKAAQVATTAAFFWYLGANPAHLFLNATQTVMLGIPVLGSRYGFAKTTAALAKAAKDFATGKGHAETAEGLTADERKAMQHFIDSGLIDKTQAHDLAGVGDTGSEYSALRSRVMAKIGWFFHHSERFNREVTALAAYRLAREQGKTHAAAVKMASDHTWTIHFDYSASNRARYMQGDAMKVLTIFRNYSVNMLYRLFRDINNSLRGATKDERIEAGKQLGGLMGMYGLMAGITGMPFYGLMLALAGALDDPDEPWDAETRMKQGIVDLLGEDAANVLLKGVPGSLTGVDLSERIGMPNLWFRSPDRELEGRDAYFHWMEQIAGAGAGIPKSIFSGLQQIHEGHVGRGVETMLPNMVKSPVRAFRYGMDGRETTMDGDSLAELHAGNVLARALGFTPATLAEQYDENRALKNAESRLVQRRVTLLNRYYFARQSGDPADVQDALADIQRFNATNRIYAITPATIRRSMRTRMRNDALNAGGIVMTPRLRAMLAEREAVE